MFLFSFVGSPKKKGNQTHSTGNSYSAPQHAPTFPGTLPINSPYSQPPFPNNNTSGTGNNIPNAQNPLPPFHGITSTLSNPNATTTTATGGVHSSALSGSGDAFKNAGLPNVSHGKVPAVQKVLPQPPLHQGLVKKTNNPHLTSPSFQNSSQFPYKNGI